VTSTRARSGMACLSTWTRLSTTLPSVPPN